MWPAIGPIQLYPVIYLLSLALHFLLAVLLARRLRLRLHVPLLLSFCFLVGMTLGAAALFDLRYGTFTLAGLTQAEHLKRVGKWGGPLAYLVLAIPLMLVATKQRRAAIDLAALTAPVPMAVAKFACFCHGCCNGKPAGVPWAIAFPPGGGAVPAGVPVHPTQLYEVLVLGIITLILACANRPRWRGTLPYWFLATYGVGRAVTECSRVDAQFARFVGPLTWFQWLCLGASAASTLLLLAHYRGGWFKAPSAQPAPCASTPRG